MNKTVTINISGIIFNIDEEAFNKLHKYLETIKSYFKNSEGTDEIMADIEARIAELFSMRMQEFKREAVTIEDVNFIQATLGLHKILKTTAMRTLILLQGYLRVRNGCFEIQMSLSSVGLQVVSQPILERMSFGFVSSF